MKHTKITSISNPIIKEALKIKEKRGPKKITRFFGATVRSRYRHEAFIVEGPHLIEMAAASPDVEIKKVFFTEGFSNRKEGQRLLRQIALSVEHRASRCKGQGSKDIFIQVSDQVLNKLTDTKTPQGIIAAVSYRPIVLDEIVFKDIPFIVICDGVQDPGNLGTIVRASDAAGADAVIMLSGTCDAFMPKAIRATAGSLFNIPVIYSEAEILFGYLDSKNIALYATDVQAQKSIYESDFKLPVAIAFGNEAHGVSEILLKKAKAVKIPIIGKAESLNVAMAASVCLYEIVRQRHICPK